MLRLADHGDSEPPHAKLALVLAAELRPVETDGVERRLAQLAGSGAALGDGGDPLRQLEDIGALILDRFPPRLERRHAQPVVGAVLATEIGRRRGVPLDIVSDGRRHFVAHRDAPDELLLDLADGHGRRHPGELQSELSWQCAHQVCCAELQTLLARSLRRGDLGWAIHLAELKLALPFDDETHQLALSDLGALRAHLN